MTLSLVPFSSEHLEDAARLLAARHARHRRTEPLLSQRFEAPVAARDELERALSADGVSGAAAFRDGRLAGYVIGAPRDSAVWGENVWVEAAGHAVEEVEIARDLYAAAAAKWFEQGLRRHYVFIPAEPQLVDTWFRLGFGQQQAHGAREVSAPDEIGLPDGVEIRRPRSDDIEALLAVDLVLPEQLRSSPIFSSHPLPTPDELRSEWRSTLAGDLETVLIACLEGRPVACSSFRDAGRSTQHAGLARPDRACYLSFAATLPEAQGRGIGTALTKAALSAAAEQGYSTMVTDWRVTNLLASRFWPRRGFRSTFLRLYRSIP